MSGRGSALGFAFQARADGSVAISRAGRVVTVIRGGRASRFLAAVSGAAEDERQQAMARATGNYRRGNENAAGAHPRHRGG